MTEIAGQGVYPLLHGLSPQSKLKKNSINRSHCQAKCWRKPRVFRASLYSLIANIYCIRSTDYSRPANGVPKFGIVSLFLSFLNSGSDNTPMKLKEIVELPPHMRGMTRLSVYFMVFPTRSSCDISDRRLTSSTSNPSPLATQVP